MKIVLLHVPNDYVEPCNATAPSCAHMLNVGRVDIDGDDAVERPAFKPLKAIATGATEKGDGTRAIGIDCGPKNAR